jgi:hypothetical protein
MPGFPVACWLEAPLEEGTAPGLFFLMGGSRFFLNGGREMDDDSSLTASGATAGAAALVDDSASGATAASTSPSGSSADKASSLVRFDPPDWLRSLALAELGFRSSCIDRSSFSTRPLALGAGFRFGLVSARGGDSS